MKNSIKWGITAGAHDASIAVIQNNQILFAAHAERSSRIKNDAWLNTTMIQQALEFGEPVSIDWYENTWKKRLRQLTAGQYSTAFKKPTPTWQLAQVGVNAYSIGEILTKESDTDAFLRSSVLRQQDHHHSHAAAGYYTAPFGDAAVLVIDSIGEFETLSVWEGWGSKLKRVWSQRYPHSVGLWYSAMTQRIGLKPNEDEYILMGWAALGDPTKYYQRIMDDFLYPLSDYDPAVRFRHNLHRGCLWWAPELNTVQDYADIAAATQAVYETIFLHLVRHARKMTRSKNLVLMGGCALNCVANSAAHDFFNNVWIMPNPGDAGSSIGAVAAGQRDFLEWTGPYLGYNIEGKYPTNKLLAELKTTRMAGVANGRAEYGPRALGNRSLLADPRGADVQDLVNTVKKRQAFRPFAPVIMQEYAQDYFEGCVGPYMQYTSKCKRPDLFPAIAHYDNTSRVQTVNKLDHPDLYQLLSRWHSETGCPMLLNTSLNIKGEPMVDTEQDAERWHNRYGVKVFTKDN